MSGKKPSLYSGELASPIVAGNPYAGLLDNRNGINDEYVRGVRIRRLLLLFERYGLKIEPESLSEDWPWMDLAILLAFAHVPGLQVVPHKRKPGPQRKRGVFSPFFSYDALLDCVDRLPPTVRQSNVAAARALVAKRGKRDSPFDTPAMKHYSELGVSALRQEIGKAKRHRATFQNFLASYEAEPKSSLLGGLAGLGQAAMATGVLSQTTKKPDT